jgi:NAD(P)-dependent dehydrogenase (short-subunit alcohol dehydrogenase family)
MMEITRSAHASMRDATFVVVGASGGIGNAVTNALAERGARLIAAGRDEQRLRSACPGATPFVLDASSFDETESCLRTAQEISGGRLAGVALCVGSLLLKPAYATSFDEWRAVLDTNLTTAFAVVRAAARTMRSGGSVVLCSSAAASVGLANHEAIAAAKAGIEGLVRAAAATHAPRGLRFNAIAPGLVDTPLAAPITANPRALEASATMHPLGRIGAPADVAAAILWLLDPANAWVTGQVLGVDGGLARVRPALRG